MRRTAMMTMVESCRWFAIALAVAGLAASGLVAAGAVEADSAAAGRAAPVAEPAAQAAARPWKPNIVLIVIDTLRADALPFYSDEGAVAPHLSSLAEKGVVFEKVWSTASYTAPATASLFTSLSPEDHGVVIGHMAFDKARKKIDPTITLNRIPDGALTLGEVMKSAGYRTFGLSDNYNASPETGFDQGFDRFEANPSWYWGAEEMSRRLAAWRDEITSGGPYFLYVHFIDPHLPYHKRPRWYRGITSAVSETGEPLGQMQLRMRKRRALYLSEVGYLDDFIRRLHQIYRWDRDTLLVVTSDHGEEFGEHGGSSHGKTLYEEVLRIPLFIRDTTGRFGPGRVSEPVSILDILPTLGELVGAGLDGRMQGRSLVPLLVAAGGGPEAAGWPAQRTLFGHMERIIYHKPGKEDPEGEVRFERLLADCAVKGGWKIITNSRGKVQLFDLAADPMEAANLAAGAGGEAAGLRSELEAFLARDRVFAPVRFEKKLSDEELERLRSLGYVE